MALYERASYSLDQAFCDGVIFLKPAEVVPEDKVLGILQTLMFSMIPYGMKKEAGRISLRYGEGRGIYYFGHIGYHVDKEYRGHGYAKRSCELLVPLIRVLGIHSLVITTDEDNLASRHTCERLGCELESIVPVPMEYQRIYCMSAYKCRYVWRIPPA